MLGQVKGYLSVYLKLFFCLIEFALEVKRLNGFFGSEKGGVKE